MCRLRQFLSALKPTRLGVLFAVLIGFGVGFWQWRQPPQPRVVFPCIGSGYVYFAPDSKTVAITHGGPDTCTLTLWDVASGQKHYDLALNPWPGSVLFFPDSQTLICGCNKRIRAWDVRSGKELATYQDWNRQLRVLSFSEHGKLIAVDEQLVLWDVAGKKELKKLGSAGDDIAFNGDDSIGIRHGDRINIWDLVAGKMRVEIANRLNLWDAPLSVKFTPDRRWLFYGSFLKAVVVDLSTGKKYELASGRTCALAPNGQTLALGLRSTIYSLQTEKSWWQQLKTWLGLAENTSEHWTEIQAFPGGESVFVLPNCDSPAFSPDGSILAVRGWNERTELWDLPIRKPIGKILGLAGLAALATLLAFKALGRLRRRKNIVHSSASETTSRLPTASA